MKVQSEVISPDDIPAVSFGAQSEVFISWTICAEFFGRLVRSIGVILLPFYTCTISYKNNIYRFECELNMRKNVCGGCWRFVPVCRGSCEACRVTGSNRPAHFPSCRRHRRLGLRKVTFRFPQTRNRFLRSLKL